jgi:LPLT family lysophospholipid transporter-like MFS transporter
MVFINNIWVAIPFLIVLGGLGGFLVVPMNALLQHRGHNLMGAGRSIAVQNFNEQACILGLGAFYSLSLKLGLSVFGAITAFGVVVAGTMWLIRRWHMHNCHHHREEVEHLLHIARQDHAPLTLGLPAHEPAAGILKFTIAFDSCWRLMP